MSAGNEKRQRRRATRGRRTATAPANDEPASTAHSAPSDQAAREHFRREKARRAQRTRPPEHPLEQARRAYNAMLAADAERAKGGRPKRVATPPARKPNDADEDAPPEK